MIWLTLALACSGGKDGGDDTGGGEPAATTGTLALSFAIDADYAEAMDEPPVGRFWATIWKGEEVDNLGPMEGAEGLEDVYLDALDLPVDGTATEVLYTTGPLSGEVVVLGFLDSDGNADPDDADPDSGDPVTLPHQDRFTVVNGAETTVEVYFGFVYP